MNTSTMSTKPIFILGLSCYYHDSAAALLKDGVIVAAAQEERFSRVKHDASFPRNAIAYCLAEAGIRIKDVDHIAFYEDSDLKFKRLQATYKDFFPQSIPLILRSLPKWLFRGDWRRGLIKQFEQEFGLRLSEARFSKFEHHLSHAASAFYPAPFDEAAILVIDGVGEFTTTSIWHGKGNQIESKFEVQFPHSIGLLYSAFTYYTGFKVNSGEYKVMGLAPYGKPRFADVIRDCLFKLSQDGSFKMDQSYFDYATGEGMTRQKLHDLFGGAPREPETPVTQREMDIARSLQEVTEEAMLSLARRARDETQSKHLCLAGGVALNCVGNGKILNSGIFDRVWIQPAAGDAGGALGAALLHHYRSLGKERKADAADAMFGAYLGPRFESTAVRKVLSARSAVFHHYDSEDALIQATAEILATGKVVGWHQGRMEFGPRALGARSILGDPRSPEMQRTMNLKIKYRESFRPFAPAVLKEHVHEYFDFEGESPYMLLVASVHERIRLSKNSREDKLFGIDLLNVPRSQLPAITHVDYSARIQTVDERRNPRFYQLLRAFYERTGCPVLVNTSFNVRGEPIVCTPDDSWRCFMRTEMDALVVENFILLKSEQQMLQDDTDWRREFKLD